MPPSRMTTIEPATVLRSTTRATVGAGRPDQEPAGFQQESRVAREPGRAAQSGAIASRPGAEPLEIEGVLVGLVRDPEPAARVDEPERRSPWPSASSAGRPDGRVDVLDERAGVEHVRRPEGVESEQVEVRRRDRPAAADAQIRRVHPELAGAVVTDEPDALEPRTLR